MVNVPNVDVWTVCAHAPVLSMRVQHGTRLPATNDEADGSNEGSQGEEWRWACWKRSVADSEKCQWLDSGAGQSGAGSWVNSLFRSRERRVCCFSGGSQQVSKCDDKAETH